MAVHPGFSGQKFISDVLPKLTEARRLIRQSKRPIYLQIDGGINAENATLVKQHGADVLVAASFIFKSTDYQTAISQLKDA
jgi:ribulose-phosphate 3-epimerase